MFSCLKIDQFLSSSQLFLSFNQFVSEQSRDGCVSSREKRRIWSICRCNSRLKARRAALRGVSVRCWPKTKRKLLLLGVFPSARRNVVRSTMWEVCVAALWGLQDSERVLLSQTRVRDFRGIEEQILQPQRPERCLCSARLHYAVENFVDERRRADSMESRNRADGASPRATLWLTDMACRCTEHRRLPAWTLQDKTARTESQLRANSTSNWNSRSERIRGTHRQRTFNQMFVPEDCRPVALVHAQHDTFDSSIKWLQVSCMTITARRINQLARFRFNLRATIPISKGSQVFACYTFTLNGTADRQQHLMRGKFFQCRCERCSDPTELGTNFSSLVCRECQSGNLISSDPLSKTRQWKFSLLPDELFFLLTMQTPKRFGSATSARSRTQQKTSTVCWKHSKMKSTRRAPSTSWRIYCRSTRVLCIRIISSWLRSAMHSSTRTDDCGAICTASYRIRRWDVKLNYAKRFWWFWVPSRAESLELVDWCCSRCTHRWHCSASLRHPGLSWFAHVKSSLKVSKSFPGRTKTSASASNQRASPPPTWTHWSIVWRIIEHHALNHHKSHAHQFP